MTNYTIHNFDEIDSTMNYAKQLAENGCENFTVVTAKIQKNGRGRLERKWFSEQGGLYFTVVLKPKIAMDKAFVYNFAASLAIAATLKQLFKIDAKLKWPNDVHISGKKICGILSEIKIDKDKIDYFNIGIGLNVNNQNFSSEINSVSVKQLTEKRESAIKILKTFLINFEKKTDPKRFDKIISEWKQNNITIGGFVKVKTVNKTIEGAAIDIDRSGALVIVTDNFTVKKVICGDCFHD
ncbi:MAG: biotin--[acetyl-CoA-carboxylase] ligase [Deltaproteobacteria bacterium]|nr:biotin--[acetyl-CoA-carboxylase] ligase [Deltaproteobacteria bacterium]